MHVPKYKIYVVWALLLHAKDKNLDSNHPFVRLADNLLESARFMDRNEKNEMFMLLSLISVDKYYPHITIDEHAYVKEECFVKAIEKVLELANNTEIVSHKTYADIITDIMIRMRIIYQKANRYLEFGSIAGKISNIPEAEDLFVKILTLNGTTMEYITKIVQSMQGMENEDPADCKRCVNMFLMWIIQNTSKPKCNYWQSIVKRCYGLIDVTELKKRDFSDFSFLWTHGRTSSSLLKEIKPIVCVEHDAESVERFHLIKELSNEF
ncbi:hypothetical protein NEAUS03_2330 [Nematocida ausubeli]|nr:hypothetical protein NEAUS03_2330 [Nematocida ausubeli]